MDNICIVWDLNDVIFKDHSMDSNTFNIVKRLNEIGIPQYVCTNSRLSRLYEWIEVYDFNNIFVKIYPCREIGYEKPDPRIFEYIRDDMGFDNILLIDDSPLNIKTALSLGFKGIRYTNDDNLIKELKLLGIDYE